MAQAGRNSTLSNQNGVGDHVQSDKDITSIKSGHRPNDNVNLQNKDKSVIRPILKETFDRIDTLIALDKTLGPNDPKTKQAIKAVEESLKAWKNEMGLEERFRATMKPMSKPAAKPSAEHLTWLRMSMILSARKSSNRDHLENCRRRLKVYRVQLSQKSALFVSRNQPQSYWGKERYIVSPLKKK
ncbi:unnamed protein product [Fusarium graminearum]|nr:hypothetical protein FG05_01076 [Fusarium graminearum]CZS76414.1 unnamed protein product [Fusarium graminearum]